MVKRGVHGSRSRRHARVTGNPRKFDGDQSPRKSGDESPHSKLRRHATPVVPPRRALPSGPYVRVIFTVFEPRSLPVEVFTYTLKLLTSPAASSPCVVKNSRVASFAMLAMTTSFALL